MISCLNNKYPANDKLCCALTEYDNSGTCTTLTNADKCNKVYKGSGDNTCALCKEEDNNNKVF